MIITLFAFGTFVISLAGMIVFSLLKRYGKKCRDEYWKYHSHLKDINDAKDKTLLKKKEKWYDNIDYDDIIGWFTGVFIVFIVVVLIVGSILLVCRLPRVVEKDIDMMTMEREQLIYRLEEKPDIGNELLYDDILSFNKMVYNYRYYHNNPWTSWFVSDDYLLIQPIDYKE